MAEFSSKIAVDTRNLSEIDQIASKSNYYMYTIVDDGMRTSIIPNGTATVGFAHLVISSDRIYPVGSIDTKNSTISYFSYQNQTGKGYTLYTLNNPMQMIALIDPMLESIIFSKNDTITGSDYNDTLRGFEGSDTIFGNEGKDRIIGGSGRDKLDGGPGGDIITGGGAGDVFYYRAFRDSPFSDPDTITRFSHNNGDTIDLSQILPDERFAFIGGQTFAGYRADHPKVKNMVRIDFDKEIVEATNMGGGADLRIKIEDMPVRFGVDDLVI